MCFHKRNNLSTLNYDLLMFTKYIYYIISDFHEHRILNCDNQKGHIYSIKYVTFISLISSYK